MNRSFSPFRRATAAAALLGVAVAASADDLRPRKPVIKPQHHQLRSFDRTDAVTVKFHDDADPDVALELARHALRRQQAADDAVWQRSIDVPEDRLDELRGNAQLALGRALPDFNTQFDLLLPLGADVVEIVNALNALDIVELALPAVLSPPAPLPPDFGPDQGGLIASPTGVDAYGAWDYDGARGAGVRVATIDYNWNSAHQDLPTVTLLGSAPPASFPKDHATAAMGVVAAIDNGYGTTGIAPDASLYFAAAELTVWNVAGAIMTALNTLQAGDVILIEQQWFGPNYDAQNPNPQFGLVPVEWRQDVYDAIQTAVGNGVIVVEAAGNGEQDLDSDDYDATPADGDPTNDHEPFDPLNDSGAILVGAGSAHAPFGPGSFAIGRQRLSFSNYGTTLDLQGWGESVYSLGYGDAYASEGTNAWYTATFGGTSSASAMVAGVVAVLQSAHKAALGTVMSPAQAKSLLSSTGAPMVGDQNIGPLPDLTQAISADLGTCTPGWTDLGIDTNAQILDLLGTSVGPDGPALYAGGSFASLGVPASDIARWDGTSWSALGSGLGNGGLRHMVVFDDGGGPDLYVGGRLPLAGGVPIDNIARWDGSSWSDVGGGTSAPAGFPWFGNADINALEAFDDGGGADLYIGGLFEQAGGVTTRNIARWDGTSWSTVGGTGTDTGVVNAMAVHDDGLGPALFVAGGFSAIGGTPANNIAKWDGVSWSALGTGIGPNSVTTIISHDDGNGPALYVGGQFVTAGGLTVDNIAKWDGVSWSALGSGVLGTVWDLASFDDGTGRALFIEGDFAEVGGVYADARAKWDGTRWWPVDLGNGHAQAGNGAQAVATFDDGSGNGEALFVSQVVYQWPGYDTLFGPVIRWDGCAGVSPPCPADTDGSGSVGVTDLVNVILAWGMCPAPPTPCPEDVDGDGVVGVTDLVSVILQWGACP